MLVLIQDNQTSRRLQNTAKLQSSVNFLVLKKPHGIFIHVFEIFAQCGMTSENMLLGFMNAKRETVTLHNSAMLQHPSAGNLTLNVRQSKMSLHC